MACAIVLSLGAIGRSGAQTVIDFEDLPGETLVTDQYLKLGVQIISGARIARGPLRPHSGRSALMSTGFQNLGEVGAFMARPGGWIAIQFTRSQSSVLLYTGATTGSPNAPGLLFATMTIRSRDSGVIATVGPLALQPGTVGTLFKWTASDTTIASVVVAAFARTPEGKEQAALPAIDDLEFQAIRLATVPALTGLTQGAAADALKAVGLVVGAITWRTQHGATGGTVIDQTPPPGRKVAPNFAVSLVLASAPVVVPNLYGLTPEVARKRLTQLGLTLGDVERARLPEPAGTIGRQHPVPGSPADLQSPVDVTIARARIVVPDVSGQSLPNARRRLIVSGLAVGKVDTAALDGRLGKVSSQHPAAGSPAYPGDPVDLILTAGTISWIWFALGAAAAVGVSVLAAPAARSWHLRLRIRMRLASDGLGDRRVTTASILDIPLELRLRLRRDTVAGVVRREPIRVMDERRSQR